MKTAQLRRYLFQCISLILLVSIAIISAPAQSEKNKDEETGNQESLQVLTEAILVEGQPALRFLSNGQGVNEVKLQKRDGEDSFVFEVKKLKTLTFPISGGKLYITKDKVIFDPYEKKASYFKFFKTELEEVKLNKKGYKSGFITIKNKNSGESLAPLFDGNGGIGIGMHASLFLLKTIENFDSALSEFNKLTESVRQNGKDEEEVEEKETEADVSDKYDRFQDITTVSTSKMLVRGSKRSIRTYAEYNFAGKIQKNPEKVSLYFFASATRPLFREDDLKLNFLVDDKRLPLGELRLEDEEKTKTTTKQTIFVTMPYETFAQIANSKKAEFQIGKLEYKLTDIHLEAFRKLLTYKIEE